MKLNKLFESIGRKKMIFISAILLGVAASALTYFYFPDDTEVDGGFCISIEEEVNQQEDFAGEINCLSPDEADQDILPDEIAERTDLRCVCQLVRDDGEVVWIPVAESE